MTSAIFPHGILRLITLAISRMSLCQKHEQIRSWRPLNKGTTVSVTGHAVNFMMKLILKQGLLDYIWK